jgi:hypothetical protein
VSAGRFGEQVLVEARPDQQHPCLVRARAEPVPSFNEPIQMAATDRLACLGFADCRDPPGGRIGVIVSDDDVQLPLVTVGNET